MKQKCPGKEQQPLLLDNYCLARNHLNQLLLKLSKDRQLLLDYDELIKNQLKSGVEELVQTDSFPFLSHTTLSYVATRDTTKVKIVYDILCCCRRGAEERT